jgi:hypothetical protein
VSAFAVSVGPHYRDPSFLGKCFLAVFVKS